jgi:hypothetical protein
MSNPFTSNLSYYYFTLFVTMISLLVSSPASCRLRHRFSRTVISSVKMVATTSIDNEAVSPQKNKVTGGHLYYVATPLGNMADITLRALEVISQGTLV